jgi:hypothetical protein
VTQANPQKMEQMRGTSISPKDPVPEPYLSQSSGKSNNVRNHVRPLLADM